MMRWSAVTASRISASTWAIDCGFTARITTLLSLTTARLDSVTRTAVTEAHANRASATGSLARIISDVDSSARRIPWIKAVAILPEPMNPQRRSADMHFSEWTGEDLG